MEINDLRELGLDDSDQSDGDDLTAAQILEQMETIWLNEKLAPEILPQKMDAVECLYLQIDEMEKNVKLLPQIDVRKAAHELELKRIRFLLASYLRMRLLKIENYAQDIMEQEDKRRNEGDDPYLTNSETVFLKSYKTITDNYMDEMFDSIPGYVQAESKEHPIRSNLNSFVFFQSKISVDGLVVDVGNYQDELVDVKEGSKMIMPYSSIRDLLKNDNVQLI